MKQLIGFIFIIALAGCQSNKLPDKKYGQYSYTRSAEFADGELKITLENPLMCPLRVWVQSADDPLQQILKPSNPIVLSPEMDTVIVIADITQPEGKIYFNSRLGSVDKEIRKTALDLPFPKGRKYRVIQGNNSNYTHNTDWSRYAVDFSLQVNDTICAAPDGYVVGVIDQYQYGGKGNKWKPYGNFVTIYEPSSGLFTQYVHLVQNGSFLSVGDSVKRGQPIGLSGMTGQTDIAHLHFNCLVPTTSSAGLKSTPFEFTGGYKSQSLKKGDVLRK